MVELQRGDFVGQNLFLQLVLGALAHARALDRLLERHASAESGTNGEPTQGDERLADLVLGLIALRARLHDALEQYAPTVSQSEAQTASRRRSLGLLR